MKNYTYRKYDPNTYPGHLSEQFAPSVGLSAEDQQMVNEVLAEQEAKKSKPKTEEEVDTTPWMPELYEDDDEGDIIGKMSK